MSFQENPEELENHENVENIEAITTTEEVVAEDAIFTEELPKEEEKTSPFKKAETWIIIALFAIPAIWFISKQFRKEDNPQQTQTQQQADIAAQISMLEQRAASEPTYDNFVKLGYAYENNLKLFPAVTTFQKAIEINSNSAVAYTGLGLAETMLREYDSGIAHLTKAAQLDTASQVAKNNLVWAINEKEKLFKSIQEQEKMPEDKRTAKFYIQLGLDYQAAKMVDKSLECCKKATVLEPKNELAYNNLGVEYIFLKKYDDAIAALNKSIKLSPSFQLAKNNLKWAQDEKAANATAKK